MGEIIRFPGDASTSRRGRYVGADAEPATVIILPVIRIDRGSDGPSNGLEPQTGNSSGRRRRRRATR